MRLASMCVWGTLATAAVMLQAGISRAQSTAVVQLLTDAEAAIESEDYTKAAGYFDRAFAQATTGINAESYAKRATLFVITKKYQDGLAWVEKVAEKAHPKDPLILEQKALILFNLPGRRAEAIKLAEAIVKDSPKMHTLQFIIGDHYFTVGAAGCAKTVTAYEAYLKSRPADMAGQTDKKVKVKLGFSYLACGDHVAATRVLDEAQRIPGDKQFDANARKGLCAAYTMAAQAGDQGAWSRAVTTCEAVIRDKAALRGDSSPHYNLGQAYLHNKQWAKALDVANLYIAAKPKEAKGFLLRGQVFFWQQKWNEAEGQFLNADRLSPKNPEVTRWLGRVYLSQTPPQPKKAIERLTSSLAVNPTDPSGYRYLADAYLADKQYAMAAATAEKALGIKGQDRNTVLMVTGGRAYYQGGDHANAMRLYAAAIKIDPKDADARGGFVHTLVAEAASKFKAGDFAQTDKLLSQALEVMPSSPIANFDMGLLRLRQGNYQQAIEHLQRKQPIDVIGNRLLAKAYLGLGDKAKAVSYYVKAEAEANKLRNRTILAEIYTEWAPIQLENGMIDDAVKRLELAVSAAVNRPFEKAARRNLQLAYFQRGYKRMRTDPAGAVSDLEGATREPALLRGTEEDVFTFALGLAYLAAGQGTKATAVFEKFAKKAPTAAWLKPPYDQIGINLFLAYALYREGSPQARGRAADAFEKLVPKTSGALAARIKELVRSSYEFIAYDQYGRGANRQAEHALAKAESFAAGTNPNVDHNRAVLSFAAGAVKTFQTFGDKPVEALVNLGILRDREGDPKAAYDLWLQAKAKGAHAPKLDEWIEAKKRVFSF